jgi:DNA replication protein DnaC
MRSARTDAADTKRRISELFASFKLPTLARELVPRFISAGQGDVLPLVAEILEMEAADRMQRRVDRLRRASDLPPGKTFGTFDDTRLPRALAHQVRDLAKGEFLDRAVNVLAFGLPGTGKTHAACAIGHAIVEAGHAVLFTPTFQLVQSLLAAKRDLQLPRALRRLDHFELIILDDIGYVQQSPDETDVLFTLMAERYERGSLLITSNLVFSEWGRIFRDPMTTAAAIDRVVHHSAILEFDVPSFRRETARARAGRAPADGRTTRLQDHAGNTTSSPDPQGPSAAATPPDRSAPPKLAYGKNRENRT